MSAVDRFFDELWNLRRYDVAAEIIAPGCVTHQLRSDSAPSPAVPRGPEALVEHIQSWIAAFPDLRVTVEQQLATPDRVVSFARFEGTHRGAFLGIGATGRTIVVRTVVLHRLENGLIAEDFVLTDPYGVYEQLGVMPPPAELLRR